MDFSARLAGLKILARFENTGLGFSARAELRPGPEISARDETHHVVGPLHPFL